MRKYCAEKAIQNNKPPGESSIIEKQIKKKKKKEIYSECQMLLPTK